MMIPSNTNPSSEPTSLDSRATPDGPISSRNGPAFWRGAEWLGIVLLILLTVDALWRFGRLWWVDRPLPHLREDQQQIWRILNRWRTREPGGLTAEEWNFRVIEVGVWANGLSAPSEVPARRGMYPPEPLRQNFRRKLERLDQEPITEQTLTDLLQHLKQTVDPPYEESEHGTPLRKMIVPDRIHP